MFVEILYIMNILILTCRGRIGVNLPDLVPVPGNYKVSAEGGKGQDLLYEDVVQGDLLVGVVVHVSVTIL